MKSNDFQASSRMAFLRQSGLYVSGAAITTIAAGCSGISGSNVPTVMDQKTTQGPSGDSHYSRKLEVSARHSIKSLPGGGAARPLDSLGVSDSTLSGSIYVDETADNAYAAFQNNPAIGTGTFTSDGATLSCQIIVANTTPGLNLSISSPCDIDYGQEITSQFSSGGTLRRTILDDNNATGVLTDSSGATWNLTYYLDDGGTTLSYSGPTSGTVSTQVSGAKSGGGGALSQQQQCQQTKEGLAKVGVSLT